MTNVTLVQPCQIHLPMQSKSYAANRSGAPRARSRKCREEKGGLFGCREGESPPTVLSDLLISSLIHSFSKQLTPAESCGPGCWFQGTEPINYNPLLRGDSWQI